MQRARQLKRLRSSTRKAHEAGCGRAADFACQGKADRGFLGHLVPKEKGNLCMRLRRHQFCDADVGHLGVRL